MEFGLKSGQPEKQRTDCLVLPIFEKSRLSAIAEKVNSASEGLLTQLVKRKDLSGNAGQVLLLPHVPGVAAERVLLLGCGQQGTLSEKAFRELIIKMITLLNDTGTTEITFGMPEVIVKNRDLSWQIQQIIQLLSQSDYRFDAYKSIKESKKNIVRHIYFMTSSRRDNQVAEQAMSEGVAIAQSVKLAKDLANTPSNLCTPTDIAHHAKKLAKTHSKLSAAVLEEKDMKHLKMGLLLSVTQGSNLSPKLITMEYRGGRKDLKPIVLVGKGITFDTGGNSVKIPPHMIGQKYDMCGAATVLGVLNAVAELALPLNVIGVIPTCENMLGPTATRPEDIVTSMSGITVEILNTDAEGRLILADALTYCERFHPDVVIDIATLTGACEIALGPYPSGLMSNDDALATELLRAGTESGDRAWQLPIWDDYHDALKTGFADISNIPTVAIGGATIIGACFLAKFAQKFRWAHLDVANTATVSGLNRGATGRPIPLLVKYLINRANEQ